MKNKIFIFTFIFITFAISVYANYYGQSSPYKLFVNSSPIYTDMPIINDYHYVKLRDITKSTSLDVEYGENEDGEKYVNVIDCSLLDYNSIISIDDVYYIDIEPFISRYFVDIDYYEYPYKVRGHELVVGPDPEGNAYMYYISSSDNATKHKDVGIPLRSKYLEYVYDSEGYSTTYINYDFFMEEIYPYYFDMILENEKFIEENNIK